MVLTVSFVLFLATGLCCHHHQCNAAGIVTNLTPASGRQNHTTSPSASRALRLCAPPRPPHPASTFVTIAIRPSDRGGTAESIKLILANGEAIYFCEMGWTGISQASLPGKSVGVLTLLSLTEQPAEWGHSDRLDLEGVTRTCSWLHSRTFEIWRTAKHYHFNSLAIADF
jgi:hypothetical protein